MVRIRRFVRLGEHMNKDIIFDGSKMKFVPEQLSKVDEILDSMDSDDRWMRRYHSVIRIFLPDIKELVAQGYVVHHIDNDASNDHPTNLMVIDRGVHNTLHWNLSSKGYKKQCRNISNGINDRTEEDKQTQYELISNTKSMWSEEDIRRNQRSLSQVWTNYTPEEYRTRCRNMEDGIINRPEEVKQKHRDALSRSHETRAPQARNFIKTHDECFTAKDFNKTVGFVHVEGASRWLHNASASGDIEIVSKKCRPFVYRSLVCNHDEVVN